jgi:hypothetical protein
MYAAVPTIIPGTDADMMVGEFERDTPELSASRIFANPKSSTLTVPCLSSLILAGFRSR